MMSEQADEHNDGIDEAIEAVADTLYTAYSLILAELLRKDMMEQAHVWLDLTAAGMCTSPATLARHILEHNCEKWGLQIADETV